MDSIYRDRRSTRLRFFDYGQTCAYFISLVIQSREPLFGRIVAQQVDLSEFGRIVQEEWLKTPSVRPGVYIDEFIVMPDHFQALLFIDNEIHTSGIVGAHRSAPAIPLQRQPRTLGSMVAQFKTITTIRINQLRLTPGQKLWQRNYHDRIIRNEVELDKVRKYIRNNPSNAV